VFEHEASFRWFSSSYAEAEYKQTKRSIIYALKEKKYQKALEVGGGDGEWTKLLTRHAQAITELDISEKMLEQAKRRLSAHNNIEYTCSDFLNNSLPTGVYDVWFGIRCFEYFNDKSHALAEMHRVLKSGGEMILVTKNPQYLSSKKARAKTLHHGQVSLKEMKELCREAGFVVHDAYPAILGKKLQWPIVRFVFNAMHSVRLSPVGSIMPWWVLAPFSESYMVIAHKK